MHLSLQAYRWALAAIAGSLVLAGAAFLTIDPQGANAACATGSSVVITGPSVTSGVVRLTAQATPTTASGLTFMALTPNQRVLGEATQSGSAWVLDWDSRNLPNGAYQLIAVAHFGTATTLDCASPMVAMSVNNTTTQNPTLTATITPGSWQGLTGASVSFTVDPVYTDQYGRVSHVSPANVSWHSPLGTTAPNGGISTVFTAGALQGYGPIAADVTFAGITTTANAAVKVAATSTGASTPAPTFITASPPLRPSTSPAPLSTADANRLASQTTIFRPAAPTNANPVVTLPALGCMEKALGALRYTQVSTGQSQPSAAERLTAAQCFSGANPIPAVLAPVAPMHVKEVATTASVVKVEKVATQTVTTSTGEKVNGVVLSGTAAPNSSVFIYVFSDPLVLRAQAGSSGKWTYVLENPLQPGNHEVYAVASTDSQTFVRTSAVPITVAAAASATGGNAILVDQLWNTSQAIFAVGAAALAVVAGLLLLIIRRRHTIGRSA